MESSPQTHEPAPTPGRSRVTRVYPERLYSRPPSPRGDGRRIAESQANGRGLSCDPSLWKRYERSNRPRTSENCPIRAPRPAQPDQGSGRNKMGASRREAVAPTRSRAIRRARVIFDADRRHPGPTVVVERWSPYWTYPRSRNISKSSSEGSAGVERSLDGSLILSR